MTLAIPIGAYLGVGFLVGVVDAGACIQNARPIRRTTLFERCTDTAVCVILIIPISVLAWPLRLLFRDRK